MNPLKAILTLSLLMGATAGAMAQTVTGEISGTVVDPAGAPIAGVEVRLTSDLTQQVRAFATESSGTFNFPGLVPGDYSLRIEHPGFKAYDRKAIGVSAQEKVALHDIRLQVGDVSVTITVMSEATQVVTDSADRSILINETQITNTPIRGRDWLGLMQTLPGVVDLNAHDSPGWSAQLPTINGGQTGQLLSTIDGIVSQDSGATQNTGSLAPSVDAIAEVKVLVSNYAAEYGSRAGGQLNVTIKNGTNRYHGSAYYFFRHEFLNANEYFNKLSGLSRAFYRYKNPGGSIGGPLLIPGSSFNRSRTRLFFFFSEDYFRFFTPGNLNRYTMPTTLERSGDFSQTTTTTGRLVSIKDPSASSPFPGNIIPASRMSPAGWAIFNLFPLPFTSDPTGQRQYNSIYQFNRRDQHENRILRVDYNVAPRMQAFVRLMNDYQSDRGIGSTLNSTGGWGQMETDFALQTGGGAVTVTHAVRHNLVNVFTWGITHVHASSSVSDQAQLRANQRTALKGPNGEAIALPAIYDNNRYNLIPNIRFSSLNAQSGGQSVTNAPAFTFDPRFPYDNYDQTQNLTDSISWIQGKHSLKFGFYLEWARGSKTQYSTYNVNGSLYFGSDTASQFDTGYPFSNLFLGSVQAFGQDNATYRANPRYRQVEWYAQDSWKVARRLNLELGVRFQAPGAVTSESATLGVFDGAAYDASRSGRLLYPAVVNGQNVALNRVSGATYQLGRASFFDPLSYTAGGSPYSGMVQYKERLFESPGIGVGPRLGFAWDALGNGRMAVRGGFGIFYDRPFGVDTVGTTGSGTGPIAAPPAFQAPVYYNMQIAQGLSGLAFLGPQNVFSGNTYKSPSTYNWSFGVQRHIGRGLMLDVAYVGNSVHNKFVQTDRNGVPPYTTWTPTGGANPAYLDPTTGGRSFYTANLIRPYSGYGTILTSASSGQANYHSLQTQLNRRFGRRLQFSANWTWSKTMTFTRQPWTPDYLTYAEVSSSRPQIVNLNYSYRVPNGSRIWPNPITRTALDGWNFSGIAKFLSGNPLTVGCSAQSAPIGFWTGTPTGGIPFRCQMTGADLWLPDGAALPATAPAGRYYPLNAANFQLPPATSLGIGNTPPTLFHGPGFETFDFSLAKDIRLGREGRVLEFRAQAFNVFNHFNPGNPNTSLSLSYTTGANTNANFGTITTAVGQARRMALGLRFRF